MKTTLIRVLIFLLSLFICYMAMGNVGHEAVLIALTSVILFEPAVTEGLSK